MSAWFPGTGLPPLIHQRRFARNGKPPQAMFYKRVAEALNHTTAWRRKEFCAFSQSLNALAARVATSDLPSWRTYLRTGHGVLKLEVNLVLGLAYGDAGPATAPEVYCQLLTPAGAVVQTSAVVECQKSASSDVGPDTWTTARLDLPAADDTAYWLQLYLSDYARVISMEAHEVASSPIDTATTGAVDPRYSTGSPIWDGSIGGIAAAQTELLRSNRRHLVSWSCYDGVSAISNNTSTYKNILNGTSTTITAATPGWRIQNQYCNTYGRDDVPVEFAVYASATLNGGYVKISDGSNELETSVITAEGWYTVAGVIPAAAATKYDVLQKGHASGGAITTSAVALLEYE